MKGTAHGLFWQRALGAALLAAAVTAGCREAEPEDEPASTAESVPAAVILTPQDGDEVTGPSFTIQLAAENIALRPAGVDEPNSGHLHLFIDREPTPAGQVIPNEPGIVHLGQAQTEYLLEGLEPGEHVVIAALADYLHVRFPDARTDTVRFRVRPAQ
ncbi:MAG: DUF4399 domain-containing protein [Gemmatimonadetes bacterium]|nr:DUF4399 domain-containing protein [Gemmatimonadota bacterium]NIO30523.1 DUF4399 domain-containing protein [Gemmatimonadota bacterium]